MGSTDIIDFYTDNIYTKLIYNRVIYIKSVYIKRFTTEAVCISNICDIGIYIEITCINNISIIKYSKIYLQLFQILEIGIIRLEIRVEAS